MAWQFDRPEQGDGVVQVFRRMDSIYESAQFKLHGLDPAAQYEITDLDVGKPRNAIGAGTSEPGFGR